ncbi:hypothetical protein SAMN04488123_10335 [Natribacillus halophilus]|uniref:ClpX C4-type zinc finger n=1 Tax=Natribacillus halophilus TaxID=549003 RepID=A0A1G8LDI7_9BACI|nr:hypothetical protein SAMN04488123_10335 [Natribacillus halophilus]
MLDKLRNPFRKKRCHFCKMSTPYMRDYYDEHDNRVVVCEKCLEYAERRAFRRI